MADEQDEQVEARGTSTPTLIAAGILMLQCIPFLISALHNLAASEVFDRAREVGLPAEGASFMSKVWAVLAIGGAAFFVMMSRRLTNRRTGSREGAITTSLIFCFLSLIALASSYAGDASPQSRMAVLIVTTGYVLIIMLLRSRASRDEFAIADRKAVKARFEKQALIARKDVEKRNARLARKTARSNTS